MSERGWIDYGKTWKEFSRTRDIEGMPLLATPGTRVEAQGEVFLIGDVNPAGGVCNCCEGVPHRAIVTRYLPPRSTP